MSVDVIRSDALDRKHGFFGRSGGTSSGIYESLNCGAGSDDVPDRVAENRARAATHLGLKAEDLHFVHQVHSADVIEVPMKTGSEPAKADGMVTRTPGVALAVLSADCAPILFEDRAAGVVGAAHSGWRGAHAGIGSNVVDRMIALGADTSRIRAAIGPTISQAAYEVGPEFAERFLAESKSNAQYFAAGTGDRLQFDLPGYIAGSLRARGIEVVWTGHCTFTDEDRFFSYRRNTKAKVRDYGRLMSVIFL